MVSCDGKDDEVTSWEQPHLKTAGRFIIRSPLNTLDLVLLYSLVKFL